MGINILKSASVSILLILAIGCELPTEGKEVDDLHGTVYVAVEYIDELELSESTWQTLYTMGGEMWSDDYEPDDSEYKSAEAEVLSVEECNENN